MKVSSISEDEFEHQLRSYDGLGVFCPYALYTSSIASRDGLSEALAELNASPRRGKYSILLADIAIYWQLFRIF